MTAIANPETHAASPAQPVDRSPAAIGRTHRWIRLGDLGVARENLRYGEPPDDAIPELSETIKAAGLLQPLTVRPGRGKSEKPWMALDGRRRLMALALLVEAGVITEDTAVEAFEETDPARQAAAALLTNTAVPVHVADVIGAIRKMLKARLSVAVIAQALGYSDLEIKRLAALSGLPPKALQALKLGRLTLRQARLLARLPDRKEQTELAANALAGLGLPDWQLSARLDRGAVTVRDRRFALVGAERYTAAGGRIETDLFGELPDRLLDPDILGAQWRERAGRVAAILEREGLSMHLAVDVEPALPDELEPVDHYAHGLGADEAKVHGAALAALSEMIDALRDLDFGGDDAVEALAELARRRLALVQAARPGRLVVALVLWPAADTGVAVQCYAPVEPEFEADDGEPGDASPVSPARTVDLRPADHPQPDIEGVGHALHEARTDVATRGLIRALADDPAAALVALIARLFVVLALRAAFHKAMGALTIEAAPYERPKARVIEALDGDVRNRLESRRRDWQDSGLSPIAWVASLPHGEKMALLAELVAVSLDLREERTTTIREAARSEAAELADLCQADIALYWTPDAPYLRAHSKPQLIGMLAAMQAQDDWVRDLKKDELVDWVAEQAAERGWAPPCLAWTTETHSPSKAEDCAPTPEVDEAAARIAA